MDGTYSNMTFVCSKTDDISPKEIEETLDHDGELEELHRREKNPIKDISTAKESVVSSEYAHKNLCRTIRQLERSLKGWKKLARKAKIHDFVEVPQDLSKKRKRQTKDSLPAKRQKPADADELADDDASADSHTDEDDRMYTLSQIEAEILRLQLELKTRNSEIQEAMEAKLVSEREHQELIDEKRHLLFERRARCIAMRNSYSKISIGRDFAEGIRE
jgi:hypothetical protein